MKTTMVGESDNKNEKKHAKAQQASEGKVHVAGLKGGQRVKVVEAAPTETSSSEAADGQGTTKQGKKIIEKIRSKSYIAAKFFRSLNFYLLNP